MESNRNIIWHMNDNVVDLHVIYTIIKISPLSERNVFKVHTLI